MTDVVLIRHGQTRCTVAGRFCGRHEGELTDAGLEMAKYIATHRALESVDLVVSSPSRRSVMTAEAVADATGASLAVDERLRELSFGEWEDQLPVEVDPAALRRWERDPALYSPPGGETGLEVMARAVAAVRDAASMAAESAAAQVARREPAGTAARGDPAGTVAVVTHKAPIRLVVSFFLCLPPSRYRDIGNVAVGSIARLALHDGRANLLALGDVSHLRPEWRMNPDLAAWPTIGGPWPIDG